jgi:hypothetical protein
LRDFSSNIKVFRQFVRDSHGTQRLGNPYPWDVPFKERFIQGMIPSRDLLSKGRIIQPEQIFGNTSDEDALERHHAVYTIVLSQQNVPNGTHRPFAPYMNIEYAK